MTLTATPGTTEPVLSRMVPTMLARSTWAKAWMPPPRHINTDSTAEYPLRIPFLLDPCLPQASRLGAGVQLRGENTVNASILSFSPHAVNACLNPRLKKSQL